MSAIFIFTILADSCYSRKNQNYKFARRVLLALFYRQKYADAVHREIGTDGTYFGISHSGL